MVQRLNYNLKLRLVAIVLASPLFPAFSPDEQQEVYRAAQLSSDDQRKVQTVLQLREGLEAPSYQAKQVQGHDSVNLLSSLFSKRKNETKEEEQKDYTDTRHVCHVQSVVNHILLNNPSGQGQYRIGGVEYSLLNSDGSSSSSSSQERKGGKSVRNKTSSSSSGGGGSGGGGMRWGRRRNQDSSSSSSSSSSSLHQELDEEQLAAHGRVIVFVLGGISRNEIKALHHSMVEHQTEIVIGSTSLMTPNDMLDNILDLEDNYQAHLSSSQVRFEMG